MMRDRPVIVYREHPPCAALAPFVHAFWTLSSTETLVAPVPVRVVPDGCTDLIISSGRVTVVGAMTRPRVSHAVGRWCVRAVRFRPGGAHPFLRVPLHELTDRTVPLDAILRWGGGTLEQDAGIEALESLLLKRLPGRTPDAVDRALAMISATAGRTRVRELEAELGLSARHLERRFRERVGLGPKALCRITRFQHAIAALHAKPRVDWLDLVDSGCYSDQAHFIREFRALSGLTPSAYRREQRQVGFVQYSTAASPLR